MTAPVPADVRARTCSGRTTCRPRTEDTAAERDAWLRDRYALLLASTGSSRVAAALLAHYARETGWGRDEHNFALGNIRWTGSGPAFYQQGADDPVPRPYRAHDSAEDGVRDAVRLASSGRYAAGYQRLLAGASEAEWYSRLMAPADDVAGWHPYSDVGLREYVSILGTVRSILGLAPAPQPSPLPYYLPGTRPRELAPPAPQGAGPGLGTAVVAAGIFGGAAYLIARRLRRGR
jgi:hypothetical protein